ncbi:MAG: hypothetical protein ACOZIN_09870 [Myxococcota bacterium]
MRTSAWLFALGWLSGCGPGGSGGTTPPLTVDKDIEAATTWTLSTGDCDVVVKGVQAVRAALVIEKGTKVCFEADAGLLVEANGSLTAAGTPEAPILFTSTNQTKGAWKGLAFVSVNNANQLVHTDISYAGGAESFCCGFFLGNESVKAAVVLGDYKSGAQVTIQNTKIHRSGSYGLFAFEKATLEGFSSNTFEANAQAPLAVYLPQLGSLDAASVYSGGASPNGTQYIRVTGGEPLTTDLTVRKLDTAYGMGAGRPDSVFAVKADLTIQSGVRFEFEANSGILVEEDGRLLSTGTASERVVFTGGGTIRGFWKGLAFLSLGNVLEETDVIYGGNADPFCCGFFEPGSGPSTRANLVVGDYNTAAGLTLRNIKSIESGGRGITVLSASTVTQEGTNDLTSQNATPNLGL